MPIRRHSRANNMSGQGDASGSGSASLFGRDESRAPSSSSLKKAKRADRGFDAAKFGPANAYSCPIVLKNSLSAMLDFLGGLRARHSKNQLGAGRLG